MRTTQQGATLALALAALAFAGPATSHAGRGELRPDPAQASNDRGRPYDDGCISEVAETTSRPCTYALGSGELDRVVLFGDSHALMHFTAVARIGRERGWRLSAIAKKGCPPAATLIYNPKLAAPYETCQAWREDAVQRIEGISQLDTVVVSGASHYRVADGEGRLTREESRPTLIDGYAETLERLAATGATVVVIRDIPSAPYSVSACVARNPSRPARCAFPRSRSKTIDFGEEAASRIEGVVVAEIDRDLCRGNTCRPTMGNVVTYRGNSHITATYSRALGRHLGPQIPASGAIGVSAGAEPALSSPSRSR